MTMITNLRCEYDVNPLGVETSIPGLSWRMESDRRSSHQTAYRVMVVTTPNLLLGTEADLWDSGRVESETSVLVSYAGWKLRSRQPCWWKVRVWDETDCESASEPAYWEMGLLSSRNHHMFSDISAWFYKTLAGILPDPKNPGLNMLSSNPGR